MDMCAIYQNLTVDQYQKWAFPLPKTSHTKFTLPTQKLMKMKVFARFKDEICCMYLVFVAKQAEKFNGVISLLVRQDLFDRTVGAKGNEGKRLQRDSESILNHKYKKESSQNFLVWQGDRVCWEVK